MKESSRDREQSEEFVEIGLRGDRGLAFPKFREAVGTEERSNRRLPPDKIFKAIAMMFPDRGSSKDLRENFSVQPLWFLVLKLRFGSAACGKLFLEELVVEKALPLSQIRASSYTDNK
eukprot:g33069.t1